MSALSIPEAGWETGGLSWTGSEGKGGSGPALPQVTGYQESCDFGEGDYEVGRLGPGQVP